MKLYLIKNILIIYKIKKETIWIKPFIMFSNFYKSTFFIIKLFLLLLYFNLLVNKTIIIKNFIFISDLYLYKIFQNIYKFIDAIKNISVFFMIT